MDWELIGDALDITSLDEYSKVCLKDVWAPEVVYDSDTELYYMFFSTTPTADNSVSGVQSGNAKCQLVVATSKYPYQGFQLVNFKDADSCGADNLHSYSTSDYPHYYAKYSFFEPDKYTAFCTANGGANVGCGGYTGGIDPHPFVDENGDKYLFWKIEQSPGRICSVKMDNWLKPDWSTAKVVLCASYYTVDDWNTARAGGTVDTVPYESTETLCNEGPTVLYHNGKYYLTYSMNTYVNNTYQIGQAVADSIGGPYRKLTEAEGGILLSGSVAGSQEISGTGHHSFVTVGTQTYIVYHRHNDAEVGGSARNHAVDEVKWITVKDIDGNDLEVMYVNGPTCTVQPEIEAYSQYKNIADEATVTGAEDISYLTDGLLSIYKNGNETLMEYVKETNISETTTFTFDFSTARKVGGIMVYNSKQEKNCFTNVSKIEFVCEENGKEVICFMNNLQFDSEYYTTDDDGSISYIIPGAAAYAAFNELNVKSVRITIEVPEGQEHVGISEIKILGK